MKLPNTIIVLFALSLIQGLEAQVVNVGKAYLSADTQLSMVSDFNNIKDAEFYNDGQTLFFANFNNDGIYDFYDKTGKTLFIGEGIQTLSGDKTAYFYDVIFNNIIDPMPFKLSGEMMFIGQVDFQRGIVNNRDHGGNIIFGEEANHQYTSNESFVDGSVDKIGKTHFSFPIGDQGYFRRAKTSKTAKGFHFQSTYYYTNSNSDYTHDLRSSEVYLIDNREYWKVETPDADGIRRDLMLSYHKATTPHWFLSAADENALVIMRWDEQNNQWINEGGQVDQDEKLVTAAVSEYGVFTFGITKFELECELEAFNLVDLSGANENTHLRFDSECGEIKHVKVFNRWGVKVFETDDYGPGGDVFDGYSSGRMTTGSGPLPTGTYFFIVEYEYDAGLEMKRKHKNGYLHLQSK